MLIQVRYTDPRSQEAAVLSNALTSFVTCDQGSGPADLQARGQGYFNLIPDPTDCVIPLGCIVPLISKVVGSGISSGS